MNGPQNRPSVSILECVKNARRILLGGVSFSPRMLQPPYVASSKDTTKCHCEAVKRLWQSRTICGDGGERGCCVVALLAKTRD